jgi:hypothetical protein
MGRTQRDKHDPGRGTLNMSIQSDSQVTLSLTSSTDVNATTKKIILSYCLQHLVQHNRFLGGVFMCCFALALREGRFSRPPHERLAQSTVNIPSWMFACPSGRIADPTLPKTMTYSLASFYKDYIDHSNSRTQTLKKSNKKQSALRRHKGLWNAVREKVLCLLDVLYVDNL